MTTAATAPADTTALADTPDAADQDPGRPGRERPARRRRRWHRIVIPFGLVALYWLGTFVVHSQQTPSLGAAATLSPTGTSAYGSSVLADRVRQRGVDLRRVTSSADALSLAKQFDEATLFVPTPDYLAGAFADTLPQLPGHYRVVVVQPGFRSMVRGSFPFGYGPGRWASLVAAPGCTWPEAVRAGRAGVVLDRYAPLLGTSVTYQSCYDGGLLDAVVDSQTGTTIEYVAVGASDPFRNDRIDEVGNSDLALGLLAGTGPLIWVDVHAREPEPVVRQPITLPSYSRDNQDRSGQGDSMLSAFPPLLWVGLLGALVVLFLFALTQARRLGPPVAEPLPVLVPSAEVVTGRGRLYDRTNAYGASLTTLRTATIRRLHRAVDPFGGTAGEAAVLPDRTGRPTTGADATVDLFVERVAERSGYRPTEVRTILYGRLPDSADDLAQAVYDLDELRAAALTGPVATDPSDRPTADDPYDPSAGGTS